jgi:predicted small lipoprotein YifL
MKRLFSFVTALLTLVFFAGCSKQASVRPSDVSVTAIAMGAKTKSGKPVDAYEVRVSKSSSVILVVGGGKLETSSTYLLTLDGQMLAVDRQTMNNTVLSLEKQRPGFTPIPDVTPANAKGKCLANNVIDLPIDETLAAIPAPPPGTNK